MSRRFLAFSLGLIAFLGITVYANSWNGTFLWDDWHLILDNEYVQSVSLENFQKMFSENLTAGAGRDGSAFRPLQSLTYLVDYAVWENNELGYHMTNTAWHILAAWAVFCLSWLLSRDKWAGLICGCLFVVHPLHTEAVAYISGRADPLAAFFVLSATCFYIQSVSRPTRIFRWLTGLAYVCALLSRENSMVFVCVPLLYHCVFRKTLSWRNYAPVALLTGFYLVARLTFLADILPVPEDTTWLQRVPGFLIAFAKYGGLLFFPSGLHMEYGDGIFPFFQPLVFSGAVLLSGAVFFFLRMRERKPLLAFAIGWFLLFLAPHSNLVPINAYMAEHWLYLPSLGFFLIVAVGFSTLFRDKAVRPFALILLAVWAAFLGIKTARQNMVWGNPERFYEHTLRYAPNSARVRNNLAMIYSAQGRLGEAMEQCRLAMRAEPGQLSTYNTLASILLKQNKAPAAVEVSLAAIKIDPDYIKIYNQLAIAYIRMGRVKEAIEACQTAIALRPRYAKPRDILGAAYMEQGAYDKALAEYLKALELKPDYPEGWHNLGILYQRMGQTGKAVECFQKAVFLRPVYVKGHWNLGRALAAAGRDLSAIQSFEKAVALSPSRGAVHYDMAQSYFRLQQIRQAREAYDKAQTLGVSDPTFSRKLYPER